MSGTHSYSSWSSIFSISLFFSSITFFACSCLDVSKTTCSWQLTPSVTWFSCLHWSTWYKLIQIGFSFSVSGFIFSQWQYFPVYFGCVPINFSFFYSLLPFILYSTIVFLHVFSQLSFNSSFFLFGLTLSFAFFPLQDFIYCIWRNFIFFIPCTSKLFVYFH